MKFINGTINFWKKIKINNKDFIIGILSTTGEPIKININYIESRLDFVINNRKLYDLGEPYVKHMSSKTTT